MEASINPLPSLARHHGRGETKKSKLGTFFLPYESCPSHLQIEIDTVSTFDIQPETNVVLLCTIPGIDHSVITDERKNPNKWRRIYLQNMLSSGADKTCDKFRFEWDCGGQDICCAFVTTHLRLGKDFNSSLITWLLYWNLCISRALESTCR